jgi:hypothetical protein
MYVSGRHYGPVILMEGLMRFTSSFRVLGLALTLSGACAGDLGDDATDTETQESALAAGNVSAVRKGSNKCLDVYAASTANGAKIQQWTCNGTGAQSFKFVDRGNGRYSIVNQNSGSCLDVKGGGRSNGTVIHQWACNASNGNQLFEVQDRGDGYVRVRHPGTGKCLDVNGGGSADGTQVQIWSCNSSDAQLWKLREEDGGGDDGGDGGDDGGDGGDDGGDDGDDNLTWRRANLTHFTSYPDPGSDECINYNGCMWAGYFAFVNGKQPKSWVAANNIAAIHSRDAGQYKLKTLRIRQNGRQIDAKVYDMCSDSDCSGCCTRNADRGGVGFLIDLEDHTMQRFGSGSGVVEWACIDC